MSWLLKRSQIWVFDVFFGFLIFVLTLTLFFRSEINFSEGDELSFQNLQFEARFVSEFLLSRGNPVGWTHDSVQEIGIADGYVINETRLSEMQEIDYNDSKSKLRTSYDYYLFFEAPDGIVNVTPTKEGIGKPLVTSSNIVAREDPKDLSTITRLVVFRNQIVRMVLYLWD